MVNALPKWTVRLDPPEDWIEVPDFSGSDSLGQWARRVTEGVLPPEDGIEAWEAMTSDVIARCMPLETGDVLMSRLHSPPPPLDRVPALLVVAPFGVRSRMRPLNAQRAEKAYRKRLGSLLDGEPSVSYMELPAGPAVRIHARGVAGDLPRMMNPPGADSGEEWVAHLVVPASLGDAVQLSIWWPAGHPNGKEYVHVADRLARDLVVET